MRIRDWTKTEDLITVSLLFEWRRMLAIAPHGKKRELQDRFCQHIIDMRPEFEDRTADAVRQHFLLFDRIVLKDIDYDKLHNKHKTFFWIHIGLESINGYWRTGLNSHLRNSVVWRRLRIHAILTLRDIAMNMRLMC